MSFFVYVLECSDKTYYAGCTNNLEKRLKEHSESKRGAHYTKIRRPVVLKYSEQFPTLLEARRRESEIKSWQRERKEALWKEYQLKKWPKSKKEALILRKLYVIPSTLNHIFKINSRREII